MKISIIPLCYGKQFHEGTMSQQDWIDEAVELGLDGIELYEPYFSDLDASEKALLSDAISDAGLEVSKYASGCYAHPASCLCDPQEREQAVAYVKRSIDEAAIFKTNIVRVVSGIGGRELDRGIRLQSVADGMRACLDYAEEKQVVLAFEDHFTLGTKIEDFMKILELVDDERLKVNLDTANAIHGTPADLAKLVGKRVVHTHISDRKGEDHAVVVGKGDVDLASVFTELKAAGYDGWLSLEVFVGGKDNLQFSVDHVRNTWQNA